MELQKNEAAGQISKRNCLSAARLVLTCEPDDQFLVYRSGLRDSQCRAADVPGNDGHAQVKAFGLGGRRDLKSKECNPARPTRELNERVNLS
jgi:hypothetical protein